MRAAGNATRNFECTIRVLCDEELLLMDGTLKYGQNPEFDPDHPLDYLLRRLGFDSGTHFLKCLLWAILETL